MTIADIEFHAEGRLWIGSLLSRFGTMQVLLDGTKDAPNADQARAFEEFAKNLHENLIEVRRRLQFRLLWRPIRIAVNDQNRVGLQFRNKITGKQIGMLFWK